MSKQLVPCPHCGAHLFVGDAACPSCDAVIERPTSIVPTLVGMGLVATTVVGSLMISACAYGCPDGGCRSYFDSGTDAAATDSATTDSATADSATTESDSGSDTGP